MYIQINSSLKLKLFAYLNYSNLFIVQIFYCTKKKDAEDIN